MEPGDWSIIIATISLICTFVGLSFSWKKIKNDNIHFEQQLKAQQQLISILREQVMILRNGLEKKAQDGDWERGFKEKELELKNKKEEWARMKDMAGFLRYAFENQ
jgi:hypothetical protein